MSTQPNPSPTAGMNIAQRILHVGGRNNAAGYVEFGSTQAVEALVRQVLRDLPAQTVLPEDWQQRMAASLGHCEQTAQAQGTPLDWGDVAQAIRVMGVEASRRGEMFPQTSSEQRQDREAERNVIGSLEFYKEQLHRLAGWPSKAAAPAPLPHQADKQRLDDYATEINRLRNVIQSACYGGTDAMIERWKQLFPDEPVPSVKAQQAKAMPFKITEGQHVAACKVLLRAHGLDGLPQRMLDAVIAAAVYPTPAPETCGNCDTPAPGCGGMFASDGKACKFHGSGSTASVCDSVQVRASGKSAVDSCVAGLVNVLKEDMNP